MRLLRRFSELDWTAAGASTFVLPGPSGANKAMSLPLRLAMWTDLADCVDQLGRALSHLTERPAPTLESRER